MFNSTTNSNILDQLNNIVHGHEKAKKILINLVNRAKTRYYQIHGLQVKEPDRLLNTMNCILIGKSGTGKTHLVESLRSVCNFPLYKIDATQLTQTSAGDGIKLHDLLISLRKWAQDLVDSSPKGMYFSAQGVLDQTVVFVDEIDKLGNKGSEGWNQRVQSNFLKFFENKVDGFNGLSFVFAGAFMEMPRGSKASNSIGFFNNTNVPPTNMDSKIVETGLLPELVGRIHHIVELDQLTKEDYKSILLKLLIPKKNDELLFLTGRELAINGEEVDSIIKEALVSEQGVRFMSKKLEEHIIDIEFNLYKHDNLF